MSNKHGHQARKRFGQNFLHDPGVIERIVRAINPKPEDSIVEIGPGLGAITEEILAINIPMLSRFYSAIVVHGSSGKFVNFVPG